jgi:xanthine phosphoribosyltransferase
VITAEASGIPGTHCRPPPRARWCAKKYPQHRVSAAFVREVASPTKGTEYRVEIARRLLDTGRRVLIVDDFLSGGRTAEALGDIVEEAGSTVVGFAFVIEKTFVAGRSRLAARGWPVDSLVMVNSMTTGLEIEATPAERKSHVDAAE